tara:strand:- start:214 stop:1002 length:789 start_codon:yes stop_codon:yes gene_type:complete
MCISQRTLKRWANNPTPDKRPTTAPVKQPRQLSEDEEQRILMVCNLPQYADLPASQIVPLLADKGVFWYLYLILDIYSRKIVGWEVHETESGELAKQLVERTLLREGCWHNPPVLHSDNGAPMTSFTLKSRLANLGMAMSHNRPRVSNDNPYSESLFRTVKYCPKWPRKGFNSLSHVRQWMMDFVNVYNEHHLHSGINFVTPGSRHRGEDNAILAARAALYEQQKRSRPERWSGNTRNWTPVGDVALNPSNVEEIKRNTAVA